MARNKSRQSKSARKRSPIEIDPRLPEWYHRVRQLDSRRELDPSVFDEDISDINDSEKDSEASFECTCGSDASDCECDDLDEGNSDPAGDDYGDPLYYEYWGMREERKQELAKLQQMRQREVDHHVVCEENVGKARLAAEEREHQGKRGRRMKLSSASFNIYSSQYTKSLPLNHPHDTLYVQFYTLADQCRRSNDDQLSKPISGHIYLDECNRPQLVPFQAPSYTSLSGISIDLMNSKDKVTVTFIDRDHLKLVIPKHVVEDRPSSSSPSPSKTPGSFEFVGISRKLERKEKRKREEEEERSRAKIRRQHSPSPPESWFNLNHPMGAYYHPDSRGW